MKQDLTPLKAVFAPTGKLRASINLGNPILAARGASGPKGVSVDLATELARQLDVELECVVHESAGASVDTVHQERADVGFFAIDPKRGEGVHFTAAYVLIEGCYLVRDASPGTHCLVLVESEWHGRMLRAAGAMPQIGRAHV